MCKKNDYLYACHSLYFHPLTKIKLSLLEEKENIEKLKERERERDRPMYIIHSSHDPIAKIKYLTLEEKQSSENQAVTMHDGCVL